MNLIDKILHREHPVDKYRRGHPDLFRGLAEGIVKREQSYNMYGRIWPAKAPGDWS